MKITVNDAINLYNVLSSCQLNQIENQEAKKKLLKNGIKVLGIVKDFESSRDKVARDSQGKEDQDNLFQQAVQELLNEQVDETFEVMTKEEIEAVVPAIPSFTLGMYAAFEAIFGPQDEEEAETK